MNMNNPPLGQVPGNVSGITSKNTDRSAITGLIANDTDISNNMGISKRGTFSDPSSIHGVTLLFSIVCSCCVLWQLFQIYIPWFHPILKISVCMLWISLVYILGYQKDDPRSKLSTTPTCSPSYITYFSWLLPAIFLLVLASSPTDISLKTPSTLQIPSCLTIAILVWLYFRFLVISVFETNFSLDQVRSEFCREHSITGLITCTFDVDIKGAIRFINRSKKKHDVLVSPNNTSLDVSVTGAEDSSFMNNIVPVTITHIAIKAVAKALSEHPVLYKRRVCISCLAIDGTYQTKGIAVAAPGPSTLGSSHDVESYIVLPNANNLTIEEISYEISTQTDQIHEDFRSTRLIFFPWWTHLFLHKLGILRSTFRSHRQPIQLYDCAAMVITSPNSSKSAQVNINVSPPLIDTVTSPPIVVVIGGVHLAKTTEKSQTLMTVSVSMNCLYASVATCRRFCEQVQNLLQTPVLCDS